jgi:myotubularin-related protein 3/4
LKKNNFLTALIRYDNDQFFQNLATSDWFTALSRILVMSNQIIHSMVEGVTPLIHCSDGWDRTSQVASLTQILIDPYFRTMHGFAILVEKDWVQFGHQFAVRNGIANYNEKERSPIFI